MKENAIPAMTGKNIRAKMRYLWKVSVGQRRYVVLTCVMGICSVLFSLAFIGVSKRVIDIATGGGRREPDAGGVAACHPAAVAVGMQCDG